MSISASSIAAFGARVANALAETFPCTVTFDDSTTASAAWMPGGQTRQLEVSAKLTRLTGQVRIPFANATAGKMPAVGALITIDGTPYRVLDIMARDMDASWRIDVIQPGR